MKITVQEIKKFEYSKEGKRGPNGTLVYPKDIRWDDEQRGFGVRVFPSGQKSYVYKYRTVQNEQRLYTVGNAAELSLDEARRRTKSFAVQVIDGGDPAKERHDARHGMLMSELCILYSEHVINQWSKTHSDEVTRLIKLRISPALGRKQVQHITQADIRNLRHQIGVDEDHKPTANKIRRILHSMFEKASEWSFVDSSFMNPAKGIEDFRETEREAYVKPEDMRVLASAIETEPNKSAKLAIWMLIFTGKRKMEVLSARWDDIDEAGNTLKLRVKGDKQEQEKVEFLPLSNEALGVLDRAKKLRVVGNPFIFPGKKPGRHIINVRKPWERVKAEAVKNGANSVKGVVIHGLRHTAAVWLINHSDADVELVGKVLGHKSNIATRRYAKYKIATKERAMQSIGTMVTEAIKKQPAEVRTITQEAPLITNSE